MAEHETPEDPLTGFYRERIRALERERDRLQTLLAMAQQDGGGGDGERSGPG